MVSYPLQISITLQCFRSSTVSLFTSFILMMYPLNEMKKAPEIWMIVEEKKCAWVLGGTHSGVYLRTKREILIQTDQTETGEQLCPLFASAGTGRRFPIDARVFRIQSEKSSNESVKWMKNASLIPFVGGAYPATRKLYQTHKFFTFANILII